MWRSLHDGESNIYESYIKILYLLESPNPPTQKKYNLSEGKRAPFTEADQFFSSNNVKQSSSLVVNGGLLLHFFYNKGIPNHINAKIILLKVREFGVSNSPFQFSFLCVMSQFACDSIIYWRLKHIIVTIKYSLHFFSILHLSQTR